MKITSSDKVKIRILEGLSELQEEVSYYALRKKTKLSINTFLNNALFLELTGLISVRKMKSPTGSIYRYVKIKPEGANALKRIREYEK